jgi:hypothetical protein
VDTERKAAEDLVDEIRYSAGRAETAHLSYVALVERCCERLASARVEAFRELAAALAHGPLPMPADVGHALRSGRQIRSAGREQA